MILNGNAFDTAAVAGSMTVTLALPAFWISAIVISAVSCVLLMKCVGRSLPFHWTVAFAAKLAFGEFAEEGMLASARVLPKKLEESGFEFRYRELGCAIADLLQ